MANKKKKSKAKVKIVKKAKPVKKIAVKKKTPKAVVKKAKPASKAKKAVKKPVKKTPVKAVMKPLTPRVNIDYSKAVTPLGDRLVVRANKSVERLTAGGIIIPDMALAVTGYLRGTVLAVGGGGKNKKGHLRPLDVKIGDVVLFAEHSGSKVEFNSEELIIIHESDVMGIVQN